MKKTWLCSSGFVYHYSNHFTAPRHVNLIDTLAFPAIPDLINLKKNNNKSNNIPYFPLPLWASSPSRHFSPLNPLCYLQLAIVSQVLLWTSSE